MRNVEGYDFLTEEDADIAREEVSRINFISEKMKEDNPKAVLAVYTRMIQSKTFVTPVGCDYLKTLQDYLYRSPEIDDSLVPDIPVLVNYKESISSENRNESTGKKRLESSQVKNYRKEYITSLIINAVLAIAVISMFMIALSADTPNIINYRNAIVNEYAEWSQELSDKEAELRQREADLADRETQEN